MSRKPHSFCPNVEALEERSLMACNVFMGPGGVLNWETLESVSPTVKPRGDDGCLP